MHALDAFGDHAPRAEAPILCVETEFYIQDKGQRVRGFFLLLPDAPSLKAILRAVRRARGCPGAWGAPASGVGERKRRTPAAAPQGPITPYRAPAISGGRSTAPPAR